MCRLAVDCYIRMTSCNNQISVSPGRKVYVDALDTGQHGRHFRIGRPLTEQKNPQLCRFAGYLRKISAYAGRPIQKLANRLEGPPLRGL